MKKIVAFGIGIVLAGSLYSQSLVELSRQEKARRERLKAVTGRVVTNADLTAIGKTPAVTSSADFPVGSNIPQGGNLGMSGGPEQESAARSSDRVMVPTVLENGPALPMPAKKGGQAPAGESLEARLKAAHEQVDLLTTKMAALWQEFYSANTMVPQSVIQQRMDELNQKLVEAQKVENEIQAQMDAAKGKR